MIDEYYFWLLNYIQGADKVSASLLLILLKTLGGIFALPGAPFTVLAGALFGTFLGTVISIIGNMFGAVLAFLLAKYLFHDYVQNKVLVKYPKISDYESKLSKNGFWTVTFLRLIPIFPFNVFNFILGVTKIKFWEYFWGTLLGIIPGTVLFVYFGESVAVLSVYNIVFAVIGIVGLTYVGKFWKWK